MGISPHTLRSRDLTERVLRLRVLDVQLLCGRPAAAVQEPVDCVGVSPDGGGHQPLAAGQTVADCSADTTGEPRRAQGALPREH
jgi:hypothetical protein